MVKEKITKKHKSHKTTKKPEVELTSEKAPKCESCSFSKHYLTIGVVVAIIAIFLLVTNADKLFPGGDDVVPSDDALVYVNGVAITKATVTTEIAKLPEFYQQMGESELQSALLEQLIAKELILQEAEAKGITLTDAEVDEYIAEALVEAGLTMEDFEAQLSLNGQTIDDIKADLESTLIVNKLAEQEIQVEVTDEDIEAYFNENSASLIQYHASHILVCWEGKTSCTQERTQEEAEAIVAEIQTELDIGEDFASLAEEYSDGPSASVGGELGWFGQGQMVPEFEEATATLNVGEISEQVETDFGYHIIILNDKKDSFEDFEEELKETLENQELQTALEDYIGTLEATATIEYVEQTADTTDTTTADTTTDTTDTTTTTQTTSSSTFTVKEDAEICTEDGKPVVYLFSTTWCPHCKWITETFESTAQEYVDSGDIVAYHWEIDINDDTMTAEEEGEVPQEHLAIYQEFNPRGSIPTFVFGCKYSRVGNGYESAGDLAAEEAEFRQVIETLLEEV